MSSTPEFRQEFVARLTQACDVSEIVPPPFQGRQQMIALRLGLAPEAVSKWFKGISMPRPAKMTELAELLGVDVAWLSMGVNSDMGRAERKTAAKHASAAAMYLRSVMELAGVHCADPNPNDPHFESIDFYANLSGVAMPVRVTLGRQVGDDIYDMPIPNDYSALRHYGVIQWAPGKFDVIDISKEKIDKDKTPKNGDFVIQLNRVGDLGYTSKHDEWMTVKDFSAFARVR